MLCFFFSPLVSLADFELSALEVCYYYPLALGPLDDHDLDACAHSGAVLHNAEQALESDKIS